MAKYVKVTLPKNQPEHSIKLSDAIIAKNTAEGVGSSLDGVIDVVDFTAKVTNAKTKRASAAQKEVDAQSKYGRCKTKAGLAAGQPKGTINTIRWYVIQVRDLLLIIHSGTEEDLSLYGFNVVISTTGARKNVRVDNPELAEEMIELGEAIIAQHTALGVGSPLTAALVDMVAFAALVTDARTLLDEWTVLRGEIQALNNEALNIIGYGAGQTISTEGTLYNYFGKIRTRLLQKFQGTEEDLSMWGFKVIISSKRKKKGNSISIKGKVTDKDTDDALGNALVYVEETDTFTLTNDDGNFEFEKMPDGTYTVLAHKTGYELSTKPDVVVAAGAVTTVDFELEAQAPANSGSISGKVTQAGVGVAATVSVDGIVGGVTTNPVTGNYTIPSVPAGTKNVHCVLTSDPTEFLDLPANVVAGGNVVVNFDFV